ncbi:hypothetical protein RJ639_012877 [Escallonia herrerae]|uniref:Pentatricopeptide repeat-containing protein n=1 Tax=Escallonia herrerae TaxID=1293975 RepID=A0AA88VMH7_9ASTE|nr:hypothetical protein RJ639_012877 [Escallonia herrerae]
MRPPLSAFSVFTRPFATRPLPLDPLPTPSASTHTGDDKNLCFSLADKLVGRGLLSSAQGVIQRVIAQCLSVNDALWAIDFAVNRGIEPNLRIYGALIRKLAFWGETRMAEALYVGNIVNKGIDPDPHLLNSMIICYCKLEQLEEAKSHFDRLISMKALPGNAVCNLLVRELCSQDRILEAFEYFSKIDDVGIVLHLRSFNTLIDGLCSRGYLDEALHVCNVMHDRGVIPKASLCKSLVLGFCKRGQVEEAELLSTDFESHGFLTLDKVMYTTLICEYSKKKKMKMAMRIFLRMLKTNVEPDIYTYNTLIHGFVSLGLFDKGWILHKQLTEAGLKPDVVTYHIMMCHYCEEQKLDCALMLLDTMRQYGIVPTVHCYTILIAALHKANNSEELDGLYNMMLDSGVVPDHVLFLTLMKTCPKGHELHLALKILQVVAWNGCGIELPSFSSSATSKSRDVGNEIDHLLGEIAGSKSHLANMAFSIYIIALCTGRKTDDALHCMERMASLGCQPLLSAYNSLIKCLCQEGLGANVESLFELMQDRGMVPDLATYLVMVHEFCKRGDLASVYGVLDQMDERGIKPSVSIYDSIIGFLGREKRLLEAENMFMKMLEGGVDPDHIFYVTMINAYSRNGQPIEARQLFDKMIEQGMRPNSHAYTALISGLVKKNMIDKGCLYLDRMLEDGLMPNTVFYTSLINQFLRKKEIGFALRLVDLMEKSQIDCDVVTHITLVSGVCKNITWNRDRWNGAHRNSGKAREMLFHLLHRKALVPQNDIRISISSHEKLKFFALKLIQKIKYTTFMPNLYLYNCIISGLCWSDRMQDAYDHLDLMEREGVRPNEVTFTILIGGHIRFGESDCAIGLFNEMNAYGCVPDKNVYDTLIKGLGKTGRLLDALSLAHLMHKRGFSPSKASYEILLSALCANQLSIHATRICEDMLAHNFAPCRYNRNWLLCMLCKENKLNEAYMLHDIMLQRGKFVDEITEVMLMETCSKQRELGLIS